MASSQKDRARAALLAMKFLGISEKKVKPVLKNLLNVYDKNWDLIEAENYRVLADTIFEEEDKVASEAKKRDCDTQDEENGHQEPERSQRSPAMRNPTTLIKKKDIFRSSEANNEETRLHDEPRPLKRLRRGPAQASHCPTEHLARPTGILLKEPKLEEDGPLATHSGLHSNNNIECAETPTASDKLHAGDKGKEPVVSSDSLCIKERTDRFALVEVASNSLSIPDRADRLSLVAPSVRSSGTTSSNVPLPERISHSPEGVPEDPLLMIKDEPLTFDIPLCETPLATVHPVACIMPPSEAADGLETGPDQSLEPESVNIAQSEKGSELQSLDLLKKSDALNASSVDANKENSCLSSGATVSNVFSHPQRFEDPHMSTSCSLAVVPHTQSEVYANAIHSPKSVNDITKGHEKVEISWINEVNCESLPQFCYITENLIFKQACVNFSLSHIGDEKCCQICSGNCLASTLTCACANETGGCYAYAYTLEGLVREDFLDECISLSRNPKKACISYCEECPVQRSDDDMEYCMGHLARKFIKECWRRCGCSRHCGNRVVQRGITCKLQVFYTSDGKGWGLRTLEDLPKGAFVCEYVGEILTFQELHARKIRNANKMKNSFPVLLDAAWTSRVLKDEEALCLDATYYGNVVRFINHRCLDANLVEIPVQVDTPDHHYYRLAFFTTRKVNAREELTWDYGIDFEDHGYPAKIFQCNCGSKYCRNLKRSTRKRKALVHSAGV